MVGKSAKVFVDRTKRVFECINENENYYTFIYPKTGEIIMIDRNRDEDKIWWLNKVCWQ